MAFLHPDSGCQCLATAAETHPGPIPIPELAFGAQRQITNDEGLGVSVEVEVLRVDHVRPQRHTIQEAFDTKIVDAGLPHAGVRYREINGCLTLIYFYGKPRINSC